MGIIQTLPGSPLTVGGASGAKVYRLNNVGTSSGTAVVPANPQRQSLTFHNPGVADMLVAPMVAFTAADATAPVALAPTTTLRGGCFLVVANGGGLQITGECQGAWQAFAASGSGNKLTIVDSNI